MLNDLVHKSYDVFKFYHFIIIFVCFHNGHKSQSNFLDLPDFLSNSLDQQFPNPEMSN